MNEILDLTQAYQERLPTLTEVADEIHTMLFLTYSKILVRIDQISRRVKSVSSFIEKTHRKDTAGRPKYTSPLEEIHRIKSVHVSVVFIGQT